MSRVRVFGWLAMMVLCSCWIWQEKKVQNPSLEWNVETEKDLPNDWFWRQRAYPFDDINSRALETARHQLEHHKRQPEKMAVPWQTLGPTTVGGRMTDIEILPDGRFLAGSATGGVFESSDRGKTWQSIFDDAFSLSIGDIAYAPSNPGILYVGTGEANGGGGSSTYAGVGVYRSDDGGQSWARSGLEDSKYIGRIVVHPQNPNLVYVAAMGELFGASEERGLYRSEDGGKTWTRVLYLSPGTGVIDVVIDPSRPDRIFAAAWQRVRSKTNIEYGGEESGIYLSEDAGETWKELTNGLPPGAVRGRIGLALAPSRPDTVYAIYAHTDGSFLGIFKTTDGGLTWQRTNEEGVSENYVTYGWWFGQIRVHPNDPEFVFALGLELYFSQDGGQSWHNWHEYAIDNGYVRSSADVMHVDLHGFAFDPNDGDFAIVANDGGIYASESALLDFKRRNNFSNMQFYACEIDPQNPNQVYGGTQDNGTWGNATGDPAQWVKYLGGDGFQVEVDPTNANSIYMEYQYGNLFHFLNGEVIDGRQHLDPDFDRVNWNAPILIDPNDSNVVYHASQRLFKTVAGVTNFAPISGDLTKGDGGGNSVYGSITAIAVAHGNSNIIYAGTDDGNFQVTGDAGGHWENRNSGLPDRWITGIAVHPDDAKTVYVSLSGFRDLDYQPHLMRSEDAGFHWQDVSANLPEAPINDILVDPGDPSRLIAASDFGVFLSRDEGESWALLGVGMPTVIVTDLDLHPASQTLLAATFGRGMYRLDLGAALADNPRLGSQLPHKAVLAELHGDLNGDTRIGLVNGNDAEVTLELFSFGSDGALLEKAPELSQLKAFEKRMLSLEEAFPQSASLAAWVQVGSSGPVVCFAEIGDEEARGAYLADTVRPGTVYMPHIAKDTAQFQTYLSSVNPSKVGLNHQIRIGANGNGQPIREHNATFTSVRRDIRDYFGRDLGAVNFAQLEEPNYGAVSMEFFHRLPGRTQMAALGLSHQKGTTLRFLHVASDTVNFWTGMVYINVGEGPAQVTEHFYGADGNLLEVRARDGLAPETKMTLLFDQRNAQELPAGTAWVEVIADQDLIGYDLFGASTISGNDYFAGIQGAYEASDTLIYPHFLAGEFQWLGVVAVNTGLSPADMTLDVFTANGELLESKRVNAVPAKGKQTLLVGDFFESEDAVAKGAWVRLRGGEAVWNGFLLWGDRGSAQRKHLAGMVARPPGL